MLELLKEPYVALFLIMIVGVLLSKVNIKGISLGSSAIVLVALIFGHYGFRIPLAIEKIGLILYIFSVGIQAGPGFFEAFKTGEARQYLIPIFSTLFIAAILSYTLARLLGFDHYMAAGIFAGVTTSTPTLAAIVETGNSTLPILSYTIAYPVSMIITILSLRLIPKLMKFNMKKDKSSYIEEINKRFPKIMAEHFIVDNPNIENKSLEDLQVNTMTGGVIARVLKKGAEHGVIPTKYLTLACGDMIKAVGTQEALKKVELLIGKTTPKSISISKSDDVIWVLVTEKSAIGKRLRKLNLNGIWSAEITRIRRAGIDFVPTGNTRLRFGDKVLVTVNKDTAPNLIKMLGGAEPKNIDFLPIAISIVIGVLLGQIKFPIAGMNLGPGITGGILLTTLILGRIGKTGPMLWSIAGTTNQFIRQMGLMFFLCGVGSRTGEFLVEAMKNQGLKVAFLTTFISITTITITTFIVIKFQKMNGLRFLGAMAGSLSCAPALPLNEEIDGSLIPFSAYSITYPFALLSTILIGQILLLV